MLHEKIDELKYDIISYANHVKIMLVKSMEGLLTGNEQHDPVKPLVDLPRMLEIVVSMMDRCVASFLKKDAKTADEVCLEDDKVDQLRDQILRELITYMSSDPSTIKRSIHLLRIASNIERVADLITNICEDIIFTVEGRVAKHHLLKDPPDGV